MLLLWWGLLQFHVNQNKQDTCCLWIVSRLPVLLFKKSKKQPQGYGGALGEAPTAALLSTQTCSYPLQVLFFVLLHNGIGERLRLWGAQLNNWNTMLRLVGGFKANEILGHPHDPAASTPSSPTDNLNCLLGSSLSASLTIGGLQSWNIQSSVSTLIWHLYLKWQYRGYYVCMSWDLNLRRRVFLL